MLRKKIYKWHRTISLIIALPLLLWASSGFMHPIMTNIRPAIATQLYPPPGIDTTQIRVPVAAILKDNNIDSLYNARVVRMGGQQFYQLSINPANTDIRYFSTKTGSMLKNGDELYARFLAKQFLEGDAGKDSSQTDEPMAMSDHDCCLMATLNIMKGDKGSKITAVARVDDFNGEYKYINRLLPVYKVAFNRNDGIRIYVETTNDRFGFAMDNKRAAFDAIFGLFHTWEWMNALGNTKYLFMAAITLLGFLTTLMGLYIFFTTKTKKSDKSIIKARRNHRYTSLIASLFTLMFTFSGGFHALDKLIPKKQTKEHLNTLFAAAEVNPDFTKLQILTNGKGIQNISLARLNNKAYWQIFTKKDKSIPNGSNDLMKTMSVSQTPVLYVNAADYTILENGEQTYAKYLAAAFSDNTPDKILSASLIISFTNEYGFVNKRLPVWKVAYAINGNERYYIETATGALSTRIEDKDLVEGYSFAFLHKHHFMDWGGKSIRDLSTMFGALMQIAMVSVGLILYFKWRKRKPAKE